MARISLKVSLDMGPLWRRKRTVRYYCSFKREFIIYDSRKRKKNDTMRILRLDLLGLQALVLQKMLSAVRKVCKT